MKFTSNRKKSSTLIAVTVMIALLLPQYAFGLSMPAKPNVKQTVMQNANSNTAFIPNQMIIKFKNRSYENQILQKYKLRVLKHGDSIGYVLATSSSHTDIAKLARSIVKENGVAYAHPNAQYKLFDVPNDPQYSRQWALKSINDVFDKNPVQSGKNKASVILAILDTGVDVNHPDLKNRLVLGTNTVNPLKSTRDNNGHGTHVAGIAAAATNNSLGVAGVAGNNNVKIMPVKVLDGDTGSDVSISDGIIWATNHGAKVINMSFGSFYKSELLSEAIDYAYSKGVLMVAAAGNWSSEEMNYPAALSKVMAVSAITKKDQIADFSSYGAMIDVCAPGEDIYSTFWDQYKGSTYSELSGTSMASPIVAGAAAAILAKRPNLSNADLRQILEVSASDLGEKGWDPKYGHGKINVAKAMKTNLDKIDDKNSTMAKAVPLVSGQGQKEKIDFGSDEDWYKIAVQDNESLQVELLPAGEVSPGVEIYDVHNQLIASFNVSNGNENLENTYDMSYGKSNVKVAEAVYGLAANLKQGTYYLKVFGNHFRWTEQDYVLTTNIISLNDLLKDTNEPNDSYQKPSYLSNGQSVSGVITSAIDSDWFKTRLSGSIYKISLNVPKGLDLAVEVESTSNYSDSGDNWFYETINNAGPGEDEEGIIVLPPNGHGDYFIRVYEVSGGSANAYYKLKLNDYQIIKDSYENNNTYDKASKIDLDQKIDGTFHKADDQDWYVFDVDQVGVLTVNLKQSKNTWCDLGLYAEDGKTPIDQNYFAMVYGSGVLSGDSLSNDEVDDGRGYEFKVKPGRYYLNVNGNEMIGDSYSFSTSLTPMNFLDTESNDVPSHAIKLETNEVKKGSLYPLNDVDFYSFDVQKVQPYQITLQAPLELNTQILIMREPEQKADKGQGMDSGYHQEMTEPLLEMVTMIDNGTKGKVDSGVFVPSKAGRYYFVVYAGEKSKNPYSLSVKPFQYTPDKWEDNSTIQKAKPITINSQVNPSFMGIEDQDWYKLYVNRKGQLTVELNVPQDIDGVFEIYNQKGSLIAKVDQSMIGEREYYTTAVSPGFYYIRTYDYLGNSSTQNYSLLTKLK